MLDNRHMEDTLFIVLEEDYRLYEHGEPLASDVEICKGEEFLSRTGGSSGSGGTGPLGQDLDHQTRLVRAQYTARLGVPTHPQPESSGASRPDTQENKPKFVNRSEHVKADEFAAMITHDLKSLVRLCTAAHRSRVGDIVWFSWNSHDKQHPKKGKVHPHYGSQGIAVSVDGAKTLHHQLASMNAYHWDCELLDRLRTGELKGCFIYPSVGHWTKQRSGILPNDSERDSEWGSWYVQEGVNPKKSTDREREIWKWVKTGTSWKTQKVADVPLNNEETCKELVWRTFFIAILPESLSPRSTRTPQQDRKIHRRRHR